MATLPGEEATLTKAVDGQPRDSNTHPTDLPLTAGELLQYLQWGLWTGVVSLPILRLINGPAVSTDQFVIQGVVFTICCVGAPFLTWWPRDHCRGQGNAASGQRLYRVCLSCLVAIHVSLVAYQGYCNAPNLDETAHLPAGLSHWRFGNFTLYRVNPPLIRMWAALPMLIVHPNEDWSSFNDSDFGRPEFPTGTRFLEANGFDSFWYFTLARWALLPVTVLGMLACATWTRELFGVRSGLVAATLWCFCPNIIAWAASITPDC